VIKVTVLVTRKLDLNQEQFSAYWLNFSVVAKDEESFLDRSRTAIVKSQETVIF
jgi:hypothetical protein